MEEALLDLIGVSKTFGAGTEPAVQDVHLRVAHQEFVTIVGESGSGKSTLLRLAAGLENPDSGEVLFEGELVEPPSEKLIPGHEGMAMADQDLRLFPNHSIADNLSHPLRHLPRDEQEAYVQELLAFCQLSNVAHKKPGDLSGGERQRITIARVLATHASLLLLDEPFSHLDPHLRQAFGAELRERMQEQEMAALMVMHSPDVALAISDRIIVMQAGRIVQAGAPEEVYRKPVDAYVARLFGQVAVLTAAEAKALGLPAKETGLRQELLRVAAKPVAGSIPCRLEHKAYIGYAWAIEVSTEPGAHLYALSAGNPGEKGARLHLHIDHAQLIHWPAK